MDWYTSKALEEKCQIFIIFSTWEPLKAAAVQKSFVTLQVSFHISDSIYTNANTVSKP